MWGCGSGWWEERGGGGEREEGVAGRERGGRRVEGSFRNAVKNGHASAQTPKAELVVVVWVVWSGVVCGVSVWMWVCGCVVGLGWCVCVGGRGRRTENVAPLPQYNELGSVRHECELQSVMTS